MKKFNDLRNLSEDSEASYGPTFRVNPLGGNNAADEPDVAFFDVAHPESLSRINAYLGAAAAKPVIDPHSIVRQLQKKLSLIGLQFVLPSGILKGRSRADMTGMAAEGRGKGWTEEYPLTYLGGRFGVVDNGPNGFKVGGDDNITHRKGHGLKLTVKYLTQDTGMTIVTPSIQPSYA